MAFSDEPTADTATGTSHAADEDQGVAGWQERALVRSMAGARARSVERLGLLVDAARELATETASPGFTVQQVVARAGVSLKSFYRYFEGKDDLLLALLSEDSRLGAEILSRIVDVAETPEDRLRAYIDGLFEFLAVGPRGYVSVLVREHRRLSLAAPERMREALAPFHELLRTELEAASAVGVVRPGEFERDAVTVFDLVLANIHEVVLGADEFSPQDAARYVWSFCWSGLRTDARPDAGGRP